MQRLRGSDAQTIYNESPTSPFVTLKVMIYEPTGGGAPPTFEEMKAFITKGISSWVSKGLGYRVIRIPFDLHHPVWIKDPNFSLDDHIHHIALPAPGDKEKLCEFVSYIMSMPMDPNRPLWDSWVVEGLEGGKVAWFCKMHHVLADGLMSAEQIINIHNQQENVVKKGGNFAINASSEVPSKLQLILTALRDLVKSYAVEFPVYFRKFKEARAAQAAEKEPTSEAYGPFMAPFTFLNQAGGPYRAYRYESVPLSEFRAISKKLDCTINDLVMTLTSEALRRYLLEYDHLPSSPLVISMPVTNRGDDIRQKFLNTEIQNNSVSIAFVPLDLQIESFEDRLQSIKEGSRAAMEKIRYTKGARMEHFADFTPGSFFRLMNWIMAKRQKQRKNPLANMAISNVPGPRETLYACDGRLKMTQLLSCGNLLDVGALGVTVWSYVDTLCFSCFFRKGVVPHPERFTQHLQQSYRELVDAYKSDSNVEPFPKEKTASK
jgi:WS/DGAT/MGAT family acyltransferase